MYIKEIKFTNFNDEEITRKYYFNLSKSDITTWNLEKNGGFLGRLERILNTQDGAEMAVFIEELLSKSYGEKSDDGLRFMKKTDSGASLYDQFKETNAYDVLYMELTTNEKAAADFINGVIPKEMRKQVEEAQANGSVTALPNNRH